LDALAATGKLTARERDVLADAYRFYRSEANHCVLQEQPTLAPVAMLDDFRPQVQTIWQRWLGESQS
jgi:glutamate-ammonia-ligase adenylyltransferase